MVTDSEQPEAAIEDDPGMGNPRKRRMRYSRSKGGCDACRNIKKKCDERRPTCARCDAVGRTCRYNRTDRYQRRQVTPLDADSRPSERPSDAISPSNQRRSPSLYPSASTSTIQLPNLATSRAPETTHLGILPPSVIDLPTLEPADPPTCSAEIDLSAAASALLDLNDVFSTPSATFTGSGVVPQTNDSFLQIFSDFNGFIPIWDNPPTASVLPPHRPPVSQPSAAVLTVPIDCDPNLWDAFINSNMWDSRRPQGVTSPEDATLLEYYIKIASTTVVVRDGANSSAKSFYQHLRSLATSGDQTSLMHAILCVAAFHMCNLARALDDHTQASVFASQAIKHRDEAIRNLRFTAATEDSSKAWEVMVGIMLLLTLSTILNGDRDLTPSLLHQTRSYLDKIASQRTTEGRSDSFVPNMSALNDIYTSFYDVACSRQIQTAKVFSPMSSLYTTWDAKVNECCETIVGVSKAMLVIFLSATSHVVEHATIRSALTRNPDDEELQLMSIQNKAACQALVKEMEDDNVWQATWIQGYHVRTQVGHEFFRLAIICMMLVDVFNVPSTHGRVKERICKMLELCSTVSTASEIGLLWPWIILTCEATDNDTRHQSLTFIRRCQWKGSAAPRFAEELVRRVWKARDSGSTVGLTWRQAIVDMGSPIII